MPIMKTVSKFALLFVLITILYLLLSGNLLSRSPIIIAIQLTAVGLGIWARRNFQAGQFSIHADPKEGKLLLQGPYKYIRHPMYAAALLLIWSGVLGHFTLLNIVIGITITVITGVRIMIEEAGLRTYFPDYAEYSQMTKRIIPLIV